jgi:tetrathionate reductase subunit B
MSELKSMSDNTPGSPERRRFMGAATATAAGLVIAPGVMLYEVAHGRWHAGRRDQVRHRLR